jgi:hypothetical protein
MGVMRIGMISGAGKDVLTLSAKEGEKSEL